MKRFPFCLLALCWAIGSMAQTVFTFADENCMSQTKDGFTVTIAQAGAQNAPRYQTDYMTGKPEMRLYLGNTITVSGNELKDIQLVFAKSGASNKEYTGLSASTGTLVSGGVSEDKEDWKIDHWTGTASSVTFTLTGKGQRQIQQLVINGEAVVIPDETPLPTAEDLQSDYHYSEPTKVLPKDTVLLKKEYAFIDQNILVHCSQGSILQATDTTEAYFNCNAEYDITFTASAPMKGLVISGFVRKGFSAACDHGNISFLTDDETDIEAERVMVITDIDATSVTISCPKQIRCYGVECYFTSNPAPLSPAQGMESILPSANDPRKVMHDGQLYIMYKGTMYNVQGTKMY